jgi:hypothetical protein
VNDQSLERANAFLAAAARRVEAGAVLDVAPAEIGRDLGFPDALSTARAVRALIARKRLEPAQGSYRLLDTRPVEAGERETLGRRPRVARAARTTAPRGQTVGPTYSDLGRAAVDRLVDLGREAATLRAALRSAREEARESRQARDEAEARARSLSERVRDLQSRADMAESNLRTLLAQARAKDPQRDAPVADSEMEAILGVLKAGDNGPGEPAEGGSSSSRA